MCVAHPHDRATFTGGHQLIGLYANGLNLFCDESLMRTVLSGTLYTYYRYLFHTHTHTHGQFMALLLSAAWVRPGLHAVRDDSHPYL